MTVPNGNVPLDLPRVQPSRSRPALLPHELGMSFETSIPPDVEPCCDLEWLEREANRFDRLGHDAGKCAARVIRELVQQMDSNGAWSVADHEAREAEREEARYQRYLADEAALELESALYVPTPEDEREEHISQLIADYHNSVL